MTKNNLFFIKQSILIGSLLLFILTTLATTNSVAAQPAWDVSVAPSTGYIQVLPGSTATHVITLTNTGQSDLVIHPKIVDFIPDGTTGQPVLSDTTTFPYLDTDPNQLPPLTIPANKKAQLSLIINPPSDAPEKEWPLVILFQQNAIDSTATSMIDAGRSPKSSSQITGTIGSNLVVLVSSQTDRPYLLTTDEIKTPILVDSFRDIKVDAILKNNGLAAVVASGSAHLVNMFGKSIIDAPLYPDTVLGLSTRIARLATSTQTSNSPIPPSELEFNQPPFQPQPFVISDQILLGPYRVSIELTNPLTGQTEIKTSTFIALPWSILIFFSLGGICFVIIRYLQRRSGVY